MNMATVLDRLMLRLSSTIGTRRIFFLSKVVKISFGNPRVSGPKINASPFLYLTVAYGVSPLVEQANTRCGVIFFRQVA